MKKLTIVLIALLLSFLLISCGSDKTKTVPENVPAENNTSSVESYPIYEVTSPVYTDLTVHNFKIIYEGMPFEEVIKEIGAPHKYNDSYTKHTYIMANGKESVVHYRNGAVSLVEHPFYPVSSPVRTDLTMDDINKLHIGMPYEEVIEILGAQHEYLYASSQMGFIYVLNDKTEIIIRYTNGAVSSVKSTTTGEVILPK